MTSTNSNRIVRPSERMAKKFDRDDYVLGAFLFGITLGAVAFPWHVYNNPGSYSPPRMTFSRDLNGTTLNLDILAATDTLYDIRTGGFVPIDSSDRIDPVVTASTTVANQNVRQGMTKTASGKTFRLLAADKRRALIQSEDGIHLIKPFSRLPDGSRVRVLKTDGKSKRLITTRYEIIEEQSAGG